MTKELKTQKMLECKAAAYDSICRLRASVDSHRNFHRLVLNVIAGVQQFAKQLSDAPTTPSEQFSCMCDDPACEAHLHHGGCEREASCQVLMYDEPEYPGATPDQSSVPMCDLCANSALHRGTATIIEESCPEIGQD